jgi:hypothetical protein
MASTFKYAGISLRSLCISSPTRLQGASKRTWWAESSRTSRFSIQWSQLHLRTPRELSCCSGPCFMKDILSIVVFEDFLVSPVRLRDPLFLLESSRQAASSSCSQLWPLEPSVREITVQRGSVLHTWKMAPDNPGIGAGFEPLINPPNQMAWELNLTLRPSKS